MEKNYENYELFDKLITNNKKAKSWTIFWAVLLCVLAGIVFYLAIANIKQKQANAQLSDDNSKLTLSVADKSRIIDSLKAELQKEVDKKVDSITRDVRSITSDIKTLQDNSSNASQQRAGFNKVNQSIKELNTKLLTIKKDMSKDQVKYFIQYNSDDMTPRVNELANAIRQDKNNFVAPAELLPFVSMPPTIKLYNFSDAATEKRLVDLINKILGMPVDKIRVLHLQSDNVTKQTVEIWVGLPRPMIRANMQNAIPKSN